MHVHQEKTDKLYIRESTDVVSVWLDIWKWGEKLMLRWGMDCGILFIMATLPVVCYTCKILL